MDVSHIIDPLNDAQREAVTAQNDHLLVLAGAGSGKTRVLVHRMAWLMGVDKVPPTSILAVTFTNKAAKEMRYRVEQMMNIPTRGLWIGTFHGIAHRLLRAHWKDAGLPENFQVLDSDDQLRLIKRVMRENQIDESQWPPKQAQWFISAQKDEGLRADHIQENPGDHFTSTMLKIYRQYEKLCQQGGLVDFGELLLRSHELWLHKPELLAHYQQRFQHILVDEFQDTNTIQYAWLQILAGNRVPSTIVGDDDQSIYGWRGAKVENIQQYQRDFPNARLVRLEQNYRSTQTILKAANAVIANNTGRLGKELWTDGPQGDPINLYAAFNEQDEANYIADTISAWVQDGNLRSESAILYRSNAQSRVLEEALMRQGIPYRVYGGLRFYDRQEIRNALAYLRLVQYHRDDAAFERVVNVPTRGIGAKSLAELRAYATEQGISLWEAAERMLAAGQVKGRAKTGLQKFMEIINTLSEMVEHASLQGLMKQAIESSGLKDYHASEKGEKGQARVENLEELVNALSDFEVEEGVDPLAEFIAQAALDAGESQAEDHEDSATDDPALGQGPGIPAGVPGRYRGRVVPPRHVAGRTRPHGGRTPFGLCGHYPGHEAVGAHLRRIPPFVRAGEVPRRVPLCAGNPERLYSGSAPAQYRHPPGHGGSPEREPVQPGFRRAVRLQPGAAGATSQVRRGHRDELRGQW